VSPQVKAALISEIGGIIYLALWVLAMQGIYMYLYGKPERIWVVMVWRWWEQRAARRWDKTVKLYKGPVTDEPVIDLNPEAP
jgi:hypothetical protein